MKNQTSTDLERRFYFCSRKFIRKNIKTLVNLAILFYIVVTVRRDKILNGFKRTRNENVRKCGWQIFLETVWIFLNLREIGDSAIALELFLAIT